MSLTTRAIRTVHILLIVLCCTLGFAGVAWGTSHNETVKSVSIELIAAGILAAIFLVYELLRDAANKEDMAVLKNSLAEAISLENKSNQQYRFFLCTPITSCIEFDSNGKVTRSSYEKHRSIRQFSVDLQKRLQELGGGGVYYGLSINDDVFGNKGFPQNLTRTQFDLYLQKLQNRHVDALHSTGFFIAFLPFEGGITNSVFESGVAAGRKVKSLYFYKNDSSLPPIMRKGELNGRLKSVMKSDLDKKLSQYISTSPADQSALIEQFAFEINNYYQGKDFVG